MPWKSQCRYPLEVGQRAVSFYSVSFPVLIAEAVRPKVYQIRGEIEGTAFRIGGTLFMTAGHVVTTIKSSGMTGVVGVFDRNGREMRALAISRSEVIDGDVGIVETEAVDRESGESSESLPWSTRSIGHFDDLCSVGYAYGFYRSKDRNSIIQRVFRGYVVADPVDFAPIGYPRDGFAAFELSFAAPRGLSGAPLILDRAGVLQVAGVVIGNSQSRMPILEREDVSDDGHERVIVQQYESLTLGIATQARAILDQRSELLRGTVREYLKSARLLGA